ncbi:MAG: hypothetical protein QME64_06315 [bacterium]|nr:hypothetical protein [bacterium]
MGRRKKGAPAAPAAVVVNKPRRRGRRRTVRQTETNWEEHEMPSFTWYDEDEQRRICELEQRYLEQNDDDYSWAYQN